MSLLESAFLKSNSEFAAINTFDKKTNRLFPTIKVKIEVGRDPPLEYECECEYEYELKLLIGP